jgi:glutathione S-transferase
LKEAYGLEVTGQNIDLPTKVQKEPWYLDVCPNGKVPTIVDHDNGNFQLWEGTGKFTASRYFSLLC